MENKADMPFNGVDIVYYTDPICCWSWGLERHWIKLREEYPRLIRWRYCMGGLLPSWDNYYDSVNSVSRPAQMGPVWMEAAHLSGAVINNGIWREDPPTSSYLSCIAVKCAGLQSALAEDIYLHTLREAVMVKGKNISFSSQLIAIAGDMALQHPGLLNIEKFSDDLSGSEGLEAFRKDLQEVKYRQIARFPTMILRSRSRDAKIITGYRPYEELVKVFESMRPEEAVSGRV